MTSIIDLDLKWKDFTNLCTLIISNDEMETYAIFYINKSKEFFDILILVQRGDGLGGTRLNESSNLQGGPTRCTTTS